MRKYIVLLVLVLFTITSTAGCIDIYLAKDLLVPHKEEKIDYWIIEHNFTYSFTSVPPDNIIVTYNDEFLVPVKPLTTHMRFSIEVEMRSAEEVWETINDTLPEGLPGWLEEIVEQLLEFASQRYIEVTIKSPKGVEWYNHKFNVTDSVDFPPESPLDGPSEGNWVIEVEGAGAGLSYSEFEYHDSFSIVVTINEPKE